MHEYKKELLNSLIAKGALKIARSKDELFTFKSGRKSPNFINSGALTDGEALSMLKRGFAHHIKELVATKKIPDFDFIFGPAYKGISLACLACEGLYEVHGIRKRYLYDRKEAKAYGDVKSDQVIVGANFFSPGQKILMIDDVITTGGAKFEAFEKLKILGEHTVVGIVLLADRQERMGDSGKIEDMSASMNIEKLYGCKVHSILTMKEIFSLVKDHLDPEIRKLWVEYYRRYGAVQME
jgi:orotate phosphoribosyltransferase